VTLYPGAKHKEHSRPPHRIDHLTSETDNPVNIGMSLALMMHASKRSYTVFSFFIRVWSLHMYHTITLQMITSWKLLRS